MKIKIQEGDVFVYRYNGMNISVVYDPFVDGHNKEIDTDRLYAIQIKRGNKILFNKKFA